jgi:hypothetical protein
MVSENQNAPERRAFGGGESRLRGDYLMNAVSMEVLVSLTM